MPVIPKKLKAEGTKTVESGPTETPKIPQIAKVPRGFKIPRNWSRTLPGDFDTIYQDEAAAIIGKSTKTLQRWRKIEYGPPFRIKGRFAEYSRAAVHAWKARSGHRPRTPTDALIRAAITKANFPEV